MQIITFQWRNAFSYFVVVNSDYKWAKTKSPIQSLHFKDTVLKTTPRPGPRDSEGIFFSFQTCSGHPPFLRFRSSQQLGALGNQSIPFRSDILQNAVLSNEKQNTDFSFLKNQHTKLYSNQAVDGNSGLVDMKLSILPSHIIFLTYIHFWYPVFHYTCQP